MGWAFASGGAIVVANNCCLIYVTNTNMAVTLAQLKFTAAVVQKESFVWQLWVTYRLYGCVVFSNLALD